MSRIKLLDHQTSNSIAAGEVVERPASVVKELCENALDADADVITVVIRNGGIRLIQVTDNGSGMDATDALRAFEPHATSKLSAITDLESLSTMGFRGEALASISAVSQVTLKTRQPEDDRGTLVRIDGGTLAAHESCGTPVGTTIQIENLFYNTPARYQFLKKDTTEAGKIVDLIQRLILARPDVSFRLINNDQTVLHAPGNNDLESAIYSVYGKRTIGDLISLETPADAAPIRISGYVGQPSFARKSRQWQIFFVNNRIIKSPLLTAAVEEGYRSFLMKGQFPVAFLKLSLPPNFIDINVHPQKTEIRFWNEQAVFNAVRHAVHTAVSGAAGPAAAQLPAGGQHTGNPAIPAPFAPQDAPARRPDTLSAGAETGGLSLGDAVQPYQPDRPGTAGGGSHRPDAGTAAAEPDAYGNLPHPLPQAPNGRSADLPASGSDDAHLAATAETAGKAVPEKTSNPDGERPMDRILAARYVGILFGTYILMEGASVFYLIDQHAAHEKINFCRMMDAYRSAVLTQQPLLTPEPVDLSPADMLLIEAERDCLERLGFEFEPFGSQTVLIRAFPVSARTLSPGAAFNAAVEVLRSAPADALRAMADELVYDLIAGMACKASVKAHDHLSEPEVRSLLTEMNTIDQPWQCPHGRPAVLELKAYELEKLFKRVVS